MFSFKICGLTIVVPIVPPLRSTAVITFSVLFYNRRVYLSVAAAAIYMASQASDQKKTQKGITQHSSVEA